MRTTALLGAFCFGLAGVPPAALAGSPTSPHGWVTTRALLLGADEVAYEILLYEARGFGSYDRTRHRLTLLRRDYDGRVLSRVVLGGFDAHRGPDGWRRTPVSTELARVDSFYARLRIREPQRRLVAPRSAEELSRLRAGSDGLRLPRAADRREEPGAPLASALEIERHLAAARPAGNGEAEPLPYETLAPVFVRAQPLRENERHLFLELWFDLEGWAVQAIVPVARGRLAAVR